MSADEHIIEARRWLQYAREDLETAETLLTHTLVFRQICWLTQQAVEKMFKAALFALQVNFPRAHDLDLLRNLLPASWQVKEQFSDLAEMTEWAVESRYPGNWPEAIESDAEKALEQAKQIWNVIGEDIQKHLPVLLE